MNNSTTNILLELLYRSLSPSRNDSFGKAIPAIEELDRTAWLAIIELAEQNEVSGLAYDAVLTLPKEQQPDLEVVMRWTALVQSVERDNRIFRKRFADSLRQLEANQLSPVILKGLTLSELYPNPLRRPIGDIDLYIPIDQQNRYLQCLESLGGKAEKVYDAKHTLVQYNGMNWELHYHSLHFFSSRNARNYMLLEREDTCSDSLCHQQIEGLQVRVFPPRLNLIFLTAHFQHHLLLERVSLRMVIDWILTLHHERTALGIGEVSFIRALKQLGLYRLYRALGYIAIQYLGFNPDSYAGLMKLNQADKIRGELLLRTIVRGHIPGCKPYQPHLVSDGFLTRVHHYIELCKRCFALFQFFPREALSTPFGFLVNALRRRFAK